MLFSCTMSAFRNGFDDPKTAGARKKRTRSLADLDGPSQPSPIGPRPLENGHAASAMPSSGRLPDPLPPPGLRADRWVLSQAILDMPGAAAALV